MRYDHATSNYPETCIGTGGNRLVAGGNEDLRADQTRWAMNTIMASAGQGSMRLMTDFSGERYWTLVAEFETPGMAEFEKMMQGEGMSEADTKEFERLMEGYHDLIDNGHREIYRLEPATKA